MSLYVVRHGQSIANVNIKAINEYGNISVPLTDHGIEQIKASAHLIAADIPDSPPCNLSIFSSVYKRCIDSANLLLSTIKADTMVRTNILINEINCGEQQGCNVEDFQERPLEKFHYDRLGSLEYKPLRGESFLDVYTRVGLFVIQQQFFKAYPNTIIVGHGAICLMLHYFLTQTCPENKTLNLMACTYWPNACVRKYTLKNESGLFNYNGVLEGTNDVLS